MCIKYCRRIPGYLHLFVPWECLCQRSYRKYGASRAESRRNTMVKLHQIYPAYCFLCAGGFFFRIASQEISVHTTLCFDAVASDCFNPWNSLSSCGLAHSQRKFWLRSQFGNCLCLCPSGTNIPPCSWTAFCIYHVYRQPSKRYRCSVPVIFRSRSRWLEKGAALLRDYRMFYFRCGFRRRTADTLWRDCFSAGAIGAYCGTPAYHVSETACPSPENPPQDLPRKKTFVKFFILATKISNGSFLFPFCIFSEMILFY